MSEADIVARGRVIKLIVCDLDGTLLDGGKRISGASLAAIERARERGVFTTLCTGRVHTMLRAYSRRLRIDGPLIAANGAVILDARDDRILRQRTVDPGAALGLLTFCAQNGVDCALLASHGCFFSRGSARIRRFEEYNDIARAEGLPEIPLHFFGDGFREALAGDIYKILVLETGNEEKKTVEAYLAGLPAFDRTSSDEGLLDISARGVSKGEGVRRLARMLGVSKREICVFGDYCNDIPMMEQAGLPIAMGNAHESVKGAALAVTEGNDEDGVARGIERYILQSGGMGR